MTDVETFMAVVDDYITEAAARMLGSNWRESSSEYILKLSMDIAINDIIDHVAGDKERLCKMTEEKRERMEVK